METIPTPFPLESAVKGGQVELLVTHCRDLKDDGITDLWGVIARDEAADKYFYGTVACATPPAKGEKLVFHKADSEDSFITAVQSA